MSDRYRSDTADKAAIAMRTARHQRRFSLRDLLGVGKSNDPLIAAIREKQMDSFLRIAPIVILANILIAVIETAILWDFVDRGPLLAWLGAVAGVGSVIIYRQRRLSRDPEFRERYPASFLTATFGAVATTALWLVVSVFWFADLPSMHQLLIAGLGVILMVTGTFMLVYVPPAAITYLVTMGLGGIIIAPSLDIPIVFPLTISFVVILVLTSLYIGRELFAHTRAEMELSEMGEMIELLRALDAPGSGGVWELDADCRFTKITHALAETMGVPYDRLIGSSVFDIVDPDGRYADLSSGVRMLFANFSEGESFRDLAVPHVYTDRWWSLSGMPTRDSEGCIIGWRGVASDVTESRRSSDDAVGVARRDPLTGVANRLLIREALEEALLSQMHGHAECALLLVDLDRFKLVNDTLGHEIGDKLLIEVARRIERAIGEGGLVGRLGGDEFAVIWRQGNDRETLSALAEKIMQSLGRSLEIAGASLHVGATIGIAIGIKDGERQEAILRAADLAMYSAKNGGRGGYAYYNRSMFQRAEDNRQLESDVREALGSKSMRLAYQPIVDAKNNKLAGREALLRWRHPTRGDIAPDMFIPIIEDAGLIHQIGDWVIREACMEAASWRDNARVSVNISAAQLTGAGLTRTILSSLAASGLDPDRLELEVTETIFLGDDEETRASLDRINALGVRLVLDDFGKGYSSFGYLSRAHFAKIKIEQSFVRGAAEGKQNDAAIVRAIIALADGLGVETTAEGVETRTQADTMMAMGVDELQGYYFGRPAFPDPVEPDLDISRLAKRA